ncbi:methyl-viologen-reducing hydrogenase delta subunit [Ammonifex degensii KC4]|uniref:Methyl-viologen-reducing hydrogenase delta subunit n=1 Tax=Ammonifex degensii (strain DSM 10501 / KC4) TaxID=429009 RepID=C9RB77_AMMDK|nr:hydrogenase iron-sulfur subunit [Ammonifex degensii]ACX51504.1 methyl-viologen-reducing hydrogenase delta subunit [Ammonifex degensii KC4]
MKGFKPTIVAFCCHYCAYAAADLAGSLRLEYPSSIRIVEVPCSGRVEEELILHAFAEGADGVLVAGCLEGDCHFQKGNVRARKRVEYLRQLLTDIGLEPERLAMYNLSSAMGKRFAEIAREMTEKVAGLGPSPLRKGVEEA